MNHIYEQPYVIEDDRGIGWIICREGQWEGGKDRFREVWHGNHWNDGRRLPHPPEGAPDEPRFKRRLRQLPRRYPVVRRAPDPPQ